MAGAVLATSLTRHLAAVLGQPTVRTNAVLVDFDGSQIYHRQCIAIRQMTVLGWQEGCGAKVRRLIVAGRIQVVEPEQDAGYNTFTIAHSVQIAIRAAMNVYRSVNLV